MENVEQKTSGAVDSTSGAVEGNEDSNKAYERLIKETKKKSLVINELASELDSLKKFKQEIEETEKLKKNQHEEVIGVLKKQLEDEKLSKKELLTKIERGKKHSKILDEISKLGFVDNSNNREVLFKLISSDSVAIDPTTNQVLGAEDVAKEFYQKFSHLGLFSKTNNSINPKPTDIKPSLSGDIENYVSELRSAKTQAEFENIRNKYKKS